MQKARVPVRIYAREKVFDSFTGWKSIDYASKSLHIEAESEDELSVKHVLQHSLGNLSDGVSAPARPGKPPILPFPPPLSSRLFPQQAPIPWLA